jgi:hypothetical protein
MSAPSRETQSRGGDPVRPAAPGRATTTADQAAHPLADLHQALGNLGVVQRLADPAVQARLEVGAPDDAYEREADAVAAAVMGRSPQRRPGGGEPPAGEPALRRRAEDDDKKRKTAPPQRAAGAAAKAPAPKPPAPKEPAARAPAPTAATAAAPKAPEKPKAAEKPKPAEKPKAPAVKATPKKPDAPSSAARERKRDDPVVATKALPGAVPSVTPAAARTIQSQQGAGQPLPAADRGFFESSLGRDLGGVRLHDDAPARAAARDIQAQAFTYGQDVYFGAGRYQPGTAAGRELLAHELTHTIQQGSGTRLTRRVQRQPNQPPAPTTATATATPGSTTSAGGQPATVDPAAVGTRDGDTITFPTLPVPRFRLEGTRGADYRQPLKRAKGYKPADRSGPGVTPQRELWAESVGRALRPRVTGLLTLRHAQSQNGRSLVKSAGPGMVPRYYMGSDLEIAQGLSLPNWDRRGRGRRENPWVFDVDHILELQVANFPASMNAHSIGNLELLEHLINLSSGGYIKEAIEHRVDGYLETIPQTERDDPSLHLREWREHWNVAFATGIPGAHEGLTAGYTENDHWTREDIERGDHLTREIVTTPPWTELGSPQEIRIFPSETGGIPKGLRSDHSLPDATFLKPFTLVAKQLAIGDDWESKPNVAELTFELAPGKAIRGVSGRSPLSVRRLPGARFAGSIDKRSVRATLLSNMANLTVPGASPLEIDDFDIYPGGLHAEGRIITDIPLLQGSEIEVVLDGDVLTFAKTFEVGDFHTPAPLKIDNSSLRITASTAGEVSITGRVDASIERLGRGFLEGRGSTQHGFAMAGGFDATSELFQPAHIELAYEGGRFSGHGILGIPHGKVPGVRSASLTAAYADGHFGATGTAEFDIPGVHSGTLHLDYDAQHGLIIGGSAALGRMPGIREGTIAATIAQRPGGAGYKLTASGTATAEVATLEAQLAIDYDDGAFLAQATIPVHRGMLQGSLMLGATNRPVDDTGHPIHDAAPLPAVSVFGAGSATVELTPWLRGVAGIRLLPNGELQVSGTLVIPGVNLWDPITPEKIRLIHPPALEFPIFGPVVLELGGGLNLEYGIGAGVLMGSLGIEYNPAHEDQTHVHGDIHLHASAFAGIELEVFVGIGLDALIGHIDGRITLGAELRAEAYVDTGIAIDWTPTSGFAFDALFEAHVAPKLVFNLSASITAGVGFWDKTWTKELGHREFGSGLAVGVSLPVHYQEGQPFAVDWNRLDFQRPEIDPLDTAKRFLEDLV